MIMGGYERDPAPWCVSTARSRATFNNQLLAPDWDRFLPLTEAAQTLVPALADADVHQLVNGPEAFTPDGEFILGESDVRRVLRGRRLLRPRHRRSRRQRQGDRRVDRRRRTADGPLEDGHPSLRRRSTAPAATAWPAPTRCTRRTTTSPTPTTSAPAGRPLRLPPAYSRHARLGAVFGEKSGWERVNWYRSNEDPAHESLRPRGWAGEHWSTAIVTEHLATRSDRRAVRRIVASPSSRSSARARSTCSVASRPTTSTAASGTITYTQLLNSRGGIESDLTITRLGIDRFLVVTGTAFGGRDRAWIATHAPVDGSVSISDRTGALGCLAIWGPRARDIVASVSDDDLTFPYMHSRAITVGDVPVIANRVTYVGELGWELYPSAEYTARLWDTLLTAGQPHGLVPGGYRAIDSLRLEKGYRAWGSDITSDTDPRSSGLGFAVRSGRDFIGRDAARRTRRRTPARLPGARRSPLGRPRQRAGRHRRRARRRTGLERRAGLRARRVDRLRVAARCADDARDSASPSRCSASSSGPRCAPSRSSTREAHGCAADRRRSGTLVGVAPQRDILDELADANRARATRRSRWSWAWWWRTGRAGTAATSCGGPRRR